jgi:hypothetical protein
MSEKSAKLVPLLALAAAGAAVYYVVKKKSSGDAGGEGVNKIPSPSDFDPNSGVGAVEQLGYCYGPTDGTLRLMSGPLFDLRDLSLGDFFVTSVQPVATARKKLADARVKAGAKAENTAITEAASCTRPQPVHVLPAPFNYVKNLAAQPYPQYKTPFNVDGNGSRQLVMPGDVIGINGLTHMQEDGKSKFWYRVARTGYWVPEELCLPIKTRLADAATIDQRDYPTPPNESPHRTARNGEVDLKDYPHGRLITRDTLRNALAYVGRSKDNNKLSATVELRSAPTSKVLPFRAVNLKRLSDKGLGYEITDVVYGSLETKAPLGSPLWIRVDLATDDGYTGTGFIQYSNLAAALGRDAISAGLNEYASTGGV